MSIVAMMAGVLLAQQGAPASPQKLPLAERIAHTVPGEVSRVSECARRPGSARLHGALQRDGSRHEPVLPAPGHHPAEERHRRALPQSVRRDVRHLRRRSAVHDRRPHVGAERTGRRARPHGALARHLQPHRQAGAVDEHQRVGAQGRLRRVRPERRPRGCRARSHPDVHDDAARSGVAAARCGPCSRPQPRAPCSIAARCRRRCFAGRGRTSIISCSRPAARPRRRRIRRSASSTT